LLLNTILFMATFGGKLDVSESKFQRKTKTQRNFTLVDTKEVNITGKEKVSTGEVESMDDNYWKS